MKLPLARPDPFGAFHPWKCVIEEELPEWDNRLREWLRPDILILYRRAKLELETRVHRLGYRGSSGRDSATGDYSGIPQVSSCKASDPALPRPIVWTTVSRTHIMSDQKKRFTKEHYWK